MTRADPRPASVAWPDGPVWSWPRPAASPWRGFAGPAVQVSWGSPTGALRPRLALVSDDEADDVSCDPSSMRHIPTSTRWVPATAESVDPSWWRDRCPDVAFTVDLWPDGMEVARSERIASVGAFDAPARVVLGAPLTVDVELPGSGVLHAVLDQVRVTDRPRYLVAETVWFGALQRLRGRVVDTVRAVAGDDVAERVRAALVRR